MPRKHFLDDDFFRTIISGRPGRRLSRCSELRGKQADAGPAFGCSPESRFYSGAVLLFSAVLAAVRLERMGVSCVRLRVLLRYATRSRLDRSGCSSKSLFSIRIAGVSWDAANTANPDLPATLVAIARSWFTWGITVGTLRIRHWGSGKMTRER
jgi:hypothetical protein